jgi:glyoxylase-like metal-dependent hydrolase (beta-lactamase superfamily II)
MLPLKWQCYIHNLTFNMKIIPLSEGSFTIDKTKLFVPYDETQDQLQQRPVGSLLVEIQPFLEVTSKDILLLDTGLGFEKNGKLQLHDNITRAGYNPSDVTKVLLTHLHKDHAGGLCNEKSPAGERISFPGAIYFIQEKEWNFAFEKGLPSYITSELEGLRNASQVNFLKENKGSIEGYIDYEVTAAHSPFHQVFTIRDEGKIIFFGGDDAPQLHQMKHRFIAKYDHDGRKAMELRKSWWETGEKEKWTILFYHDVKHPSYSF